MKRLLTTIVVLSAILAFGSVAYAGTNTHSLTTSTGPNAKRTTSNFTAYGTAAVTVEAWVKTSTDNGTVMVVNVNDGGTSTFQIIKIAAANAYRFSLNDAVSSSDIAEASIETGAWVHIAGTYDGSNVRIYLNGVQQGSDVAFSSNIRTDSPTRLGIGVRSTGADLPFQGEIDDVRVWNIARSAAQITADKSNCDLSTTATGLRGWWKMDNANSDSQTNITANDLVNVGTPSFTTDPAFACAAATTPTPILSLVKAFWIF